MTHPTSETLEQKVSDKAESVNNDAEFHKIKMCQIGFVWEIKNISKVFGFLNSANVRNCVRSKKFSFIDEEERKLDWYLELSLNHKLKQYFSLYLFLSNPPDDLPVSINYKFCIVKNDNTVLTIKKYGSTPADFVKGSSAFGKHLFMKQDFIKEEKDYFVNDTMTLLCGIQPASTKVINEDYSKFPSDFNCYGKHKKCLIADDFKKLLENKTLSDITLVINDQKFPVHKAILAARSSVFSKIFQEQYNQQILEVNGIDELIMCETLRFMYTGEVKNLNDIANKLIVAADKYCLTELKEMCIKVLQDNLNLNNVINTMKLADTFELVNLKEESLAFLNNHACDLISSAEFKELKITHPHLLEEAYMLAFKKRKLV